jgi:lactam utilization protein B
MKDKAQEISTTFYSSLGELEAFVMDDGRAFALVRMHGSTFKVEFSDPEFFHKLSRYIVEM